MSAVWSLASLILSLRPSASLLAAEIFSCISACDMLAPKNGDVGREECGEPYSGLIMGVLFG